MKLVHGGKAGARNNELEKTPFSELHKAQAAELKKSA